MLLLVRSTSERSGMNQLSIIDRRETGKERVEERQAHFYSSLFHFVIYVKSFSMY